VHHVGGKSAGEVVECFVAHRGGPVRILKSLLCERVSNNTSLNNENENQSNNNNNNIDYSSAINNRLVCSASSDFSVTFWDSQNMRPLKTVQLGASIGMVKSILLDRFVLYQNDVTESAILVKNSICIIGADNGNLIGLDLKRELMGLNSNNNNNINSLSSVLEFPSTATGGVSNNNNKSHINLIHQRTAVTSLAVLHFANAASVCLSGSEGGVVRAQSLSSSSSAPNTSASSTISLQHGAIHAIAMLPTSSLPNAVSRSSSSSSGANLVLVACASGRVFILLIGASATPESRPNNNDIAPLMSALASFVSPTGPIVQLCCRPAWSRAVYAVTSSGAVDLYASSEAVLNRIESSSSLLQNENGISSSSQFQVAPSQLKSKAVSLIVQAERRYEQNIQLLLDLAVESKRHCEDRDGAVARLQEENEEKTRILEAMTKQCETLTQRVEQLRTENGKLLTERTMIMDHAREAASTGTAAKQDADYLMRELQAATDREANTSALMDQLRMRVIALEKEVDRGSYQTRKLEQEIEIEKMRNEELENALRVMRNSSAPRSPLHHQQQQREQEQRQLLQGILDLSSSTGTLIGGGNQHQQQQRENEHQPPY
jgi:hypothetical protein